MFSLSSNFLRSTTIIQSPLTCHGTLLLISSSNTSGGNNNLFMPVITVSFNLKLVYKFKSWGDFIVYFSLTRVPVSLSSISSTELVMICFQVKMTGYDEEYIYYTHPHLLQKSHTRLNPPNVKEKLLIVRLLKLVLKSKVSAETPWAVPPLRDLVDPY